jgi:sirohydrochlorin cobaltochelatase
MESPTGRMQARRPTTALILFAHGARDPEWRVPFENIRSLVAARLPDAAVELAFLEIMRPALADAVAGVVRAGCTHIRIAPLFMAQGGHLKQDLPKLVDTLRKRFPGISFVLLPAVGDARPVLEAISDWLANHMDVDALPPARG